MARVSKEELLALDGQGADFAEAQLEEANLRGSSLPLTIFFRANLRQANLIQADLTGADLREAWLEGADLIEAYLKGADFTGANLEGVRARGAFFQNTKGWPGS